MIISFSKTDENSKKTKEVATTAWMLLIGDGFHKFIDGVSVGASFTETVFAGISVALAIICEELPHELGEIRYFLYHSSGHMTSEWCHTDVASTSLRRIGVSTMSLRRHVPTEMNAFLDI